MKLDTVFDSKHPIALEVSPKHQEMVANMFVNVPNMSVNGIATEVQKDQVLATGSKDTSIREFAKNANLERQFQPENVAVAFSPPKNVRQAELLHETVQGVAFEPLQAIGAHTAALQASRAINLGQFKQPNGAGMSV
jgi:hypothetical protein